MDDRVTAHRVTDERHPARTNLVDHGDDIVTERRKIPVVAAKPRLAVASQVDRDDAIPLDEEVDLVSPIATIARPAVHESHRRGIDSVARAIRCVRDLDTVTAA
jgi:hypothetical protein